MHSASIFNAFASMCQRATRRCTGFETVDIGGADSALMLHCLTATTNHTCWVSPAPTREWHGQRTVTNNTKQIKSRTRQCTLLRPGREEHVDCDPPRGATSRSGRHDRRIRRLTGARTSQHMPETRCDTAQQCATRDGEAGESPLQRLSSAFGAALRPLGPDDEAPPPPEKLVDWSKNTAIAGTVGVAYGWALEQWRQAVAPDLASPASFTSRSHAAQFHAQRRTERIARLLQKSMLAGVAFGGLGAVFYGVQALSGVALLWDDGRSTALAATSTGAVAGMTMISGTPISRLRSGLVGTCLGGLLGLPAGFLINYAQHELKKMQLEEERVRDSREACGN